MYAWVYPSCEKNQVNPTVSLCQRVKLSFENDTVYCWSSLKNILYEDLPLGKKFRYNSWVVVTANVTIVTVTVESWGKSNACAKDFISGEKHIRSLALELSPPTISISSPENSCSEVN